MTREDILRMAREAGLTSVIDAHHKEYGSGAFDLSLYEEVTRFAALVAAAERDRLEPAFKQLEALMQVRETQPNKPCCLAERERIISVAQSRLDHERSALAHNFYRWHAASEWYQARCGGMEDMLAALIAAAKDAEHQQTLALQQRSYEREIQLEVEAEREACAQIADAEASIEGIAQRIAAAIRARSK